MHKLAIPLLAALGLTLVSQATLACPAHPVGWVLEYNNGEKQEYLPGMTYKGMPVWPRATYDAGGQHVSTTYYSEKCGHVAQVDAAGNERWAFKDGERLSDSCAVRLPLEGSWSCSFTFVNHVKGTSHQEHRTCTVRGSETLGGGVGEVKEVYCKGRRPQGTRNMNRFASERFGFVGRTWRHRDRMVTRASPP